MFKNTYNLMPVPSGSRKRDKDEPMPGSSGIERKDENGGDFSASSSDWLPSDDDFQSSDSEEELVVKPIQLERRYQRRYSRPNNTMVTTLNKAKAVGRNISPRKTLQQIQNTLNDSVEKSSVTSNTQKMAELKKSLWPKEQSNDKMNSNSLTLQPQEDSDEKKDNFNDDSSVHEEFNKSDDNVLISNKYKNVAVRLMKKKQKKVANNERLIVKPIQLERRYQRRYSRPNNTMVTPLNKAKAVARNVSPRKILQQIQNTLNDSVEQSSMSSNTQKMADLKKFLGPKEQSNDEMNSNSFTLQPQEDSDENKDHFNDDISVHEEFNKSDDNVLISNKYKNVAVKLMKKKQKKVANNEGMIVKPFQSERRYQRHYTRPNKTKVTPLYKAKAVARNVSPRKILQQIQNTLNGNVEKSSADSNTQRSSWNLSGSPRVIHMNSNAVDRIINTMSMVLEKMAELRKSLGSKEQSNDEMNSTSFTLQPQEVSDENKENFNDDISVHEEFNKPGDNVLINNRHKKVTMKPKKKIQNKLADNEGMIPIGSGTTLVDKELFKKVNWKSYTIATRTLLVAVFKRKELATRSLSGKPSPVFQDRRAKMCLDQRKIADIISEITDRFNVKKNQVRHIITTKCADECKRLRMRKKNTKQNREKGVSSPQSALINARCGQQETKIDVNEKLEESEEYLYLVPKKNYKNINKQKYYKEILD